MSKALRFNLSRGKALRDYKLILSLMVVLGLIIGLALLITPQTTNAQSNYSQWTFTDSLIPFYGDHCVIPGYPIPEIKINDTGAVFCLQKSQPSLDEPDPLTSSFQYFFFDVTGCSDLNNLQTCGPLYTATPSAQGTSEFGYSSHPGIWNLLKENHNYIVVALLTKIQNIQTFPVGTLYTDVVTYRNNLLNQNLAAVVSPSYAAFKIVSENIGPVVAEPVAMKADFKDFDLKPRHVRNAARDVARLSRGVEVLSTEAFDDVTAFAENQNVKEGLKFLTGSKADFPTFWTAWLGYSLTDVTQIFDRWSEFWNYLTLATQKTPKNTRYLFVQTKGPDSMIDTDDVWTVYKPDVGFVPISSTAAAPDLKGKGVLGRLTTEELNLVKSPDLIKYAKIDEKTGHQLLPGVTNYELDKYEVIDKKPYFIPEFGHWAYEAKRVFKGDYDIEEYFPYLPAVDMKILSGKVVFDFQRLNRESYKEVPMLGFYLYGIFYQIPENLVVNERGGVYSVSYADLTKYFGEDFNKENMTSASGRTSSVVFDSEGGTHNKQGEVKTIIAGEGAVPAQK